MTNKMSELKYRTIPGSYKKKNENTFFDST